MPNTPNHNYNKPSEGSDNWHIPLNENFENLDRDVEIRDNRDNLSDYDPKLGAIFRATGENEGEIYRGDGSNWVLIDETVDHLESNTSVTGVHLEAGNSGSAVVAPSVESAFDGIQDAIDAGFRDIILAEDIVENNIQIPRDRTPGVPNPGFRLQGMGDGSTQKIFDPETGDPVIRIEETNDRGVAKGVVISNIQIWGGADAGIAFLGANNIDEINGPFNALGSSTLNHVHVRAGPVYTVGPRNTLYDCHMNSFSEREFAIPNVQAKDDDGNYIDENVKDKMAGVFMGTTFGQYGGTVSAKKGAKTAAFYNVGGFSITGGVTWSNADRKNAPKDVITSNVIFAGATRGFIGGVSSEGTVDWDVQLGIEQLQNKPGPGLADVLVAGPSAFRQMRIVDQCQNVRIQNPVGGGPISIKKEDRANILIETTSEINITEDSYFPQDITHIYPGAGSEGDSTYRIGGTKNSPPTQFAPKIHTAPPPNPTEGSQVLCDGDEWDPIGNGSAALVTYDTDGSWKPIFEYSSNL